MKKINFFDTFKIGMLATSLLLTEPSLSQQSPPLSDPEVASAAVTANQVDIEFAQIAIAKSKNADILGFAKTMASDHKAVIDQAVALAGKLNVTPQSNYLTKKLLSDAEQTKKQLQAKNGKEFDQAYINNEVSYHKAVIEVVESVLIPDTDNAELKALLQNVVPTLKAHLSHAEMLQQKIAQ